MGWSPCVHFQIAVKVDASGETERRRRTTKLTERFESPPTYTLSTTSQRPLPWTGACARRCAKAAG